MSGDSHAEIDAAVAYIHRYLQEPLSLSQLARYVAYSPYHFSRMFKERVGLSPQYYVSSLRLQRAKELLLYTQWSIRDIGLDVGQQSLGTFTTRFTQRVGVTPSSFRASSQQADRGMETLRRLHDSQAWRLPSTSPQARIQGVVQAVEYFEGIIFIGLFPKPIPEGLPLYGTVLPALGGFSFADVQPGTYFLMATSVSWNMATADYVIPRTTLRTRSRVPIVVTHGATVPDQIVTLFPPRLDDPPILISLPLLMDRFLSRMRDAKTPSEVAPALSDNRYRNL
ncbi:MAG: AraC family transcriptional regulator [Firmicutes bacterium]|nr:AraC family transcriptional regulator [Bacillota bacterium]